MLKKIPEIFACNPFKARKFLADAIFLWENFLSPYVHYRLRLRGFSHFFSWSDKKIFVLKFFWDVFFLWKFFNRIFFAYANKSAIFF